MNAVVLAGGQGTRLRAQIGDLPKPLVRLDGVPLLDVLLSQLAEAGFARVTLALSWQHEQIEAHVARHGPWGLRVDVAVDRALLGTAGPLSLLDRPGEPCLVVNGDVLTDADYAAIHCCHAAAGSTATVVAVQRASTIDFGVLSVREDGGLDGFAEKPTQRILTNAGIYVLSPEAWDHLSPGERLDMGELFQRLLDAGRPVGSYVLPRDGRWIDVGRPERLREAEAELRADRGRYVRGRAAQLWDAAVPAEPAGEISLYGTELGAPEETAVVGVLRGGRLSMGPEVRRFELAFAEALGVADALAVSSGTAALFLAASALGVGPGDEVVMPSLTFCAGAAAVALLGAMPVFCDVRGADDLCLDPDDVVACLTERTKAIVVTHFAGYPADVGAIAALAAERGIAVIEDAAHAPVVETVGGSLGTLGTVGCFSCYATKNVPMGEGGVLVARDPALLERLRLLRAHGLERPAEPMAADLDYDVVALSLNFRPTELGAAVGVRQLRRLPEERARRCELVERYRRRLDEIAGIDVPFREHDGDAAYHLFPVLLPAGVDRPRLRRSLAARGVQTSVHYPPTHLLSAFRARLGCGPGMLPLTEELAARELTLPLHAQLSAESVERVVEALEAALPLETVA